MCIFAKAQKKGSQCIIALINNDDDDDDDDDGDDKLNSKDIINSTTYNKTKNHYPKAYKDAMSLKQIHYLRNDA